MTEILDIVVRARGARTVARDLAKIAIAAESGSVALGKLGRSSRRAGIAASTAGAGFKVGAAGATALGAGALGAATALTALSGAAAVAGGAITAAFGLPLVAAIKGAGDFEKSMNQVANVSRATPEQMDKISRAAQQLGVTTSFSAQEVAGGFELLSRAGLSVEVQLGAITPALNLAAAGNLDLAKSADIVTNIISGFGLEVSELADAADILTRTSQSSNTTIGKLGEAFSFVAPIARELGVDFIEVNTALGALGSAGIPAGRAGRNLARALGNLANQTPKASRALGRLGVDVFDSAGNFRGLFTVIDDLRVAFAEITPEARSIAIGDIFTVQGARAIGALTGMEEQLDIMGKKIRDFGGAAQDAADTKLKGFNGALIKLKSAISGAGIAIGDTLLDPLTEMVLGFRSLVVEIAELPKGTLKVIGQVLAMGTAFGVAVLAISALSFAASAFARLMAVRFVVSIVATIAKGKVLTTVFGGLRAMLISLSITAKATLIALGPIGVAGLAIAGLGAALVLASNDVISFGKHQTTLRDITAVVWDDITDFFFAGAKAADMAGDAGADAMAQIQHAEQNLSLGDTLKGFYNDAVTGAAIMARFVVLVFEKMIESIKDIFNTLGLLVGAIPSLLLDPGNAGKLMGEIIQDNLLEGFKTTLSEELARITKEEMANSQVSSGTDIIGAVAGGVLGRAAARTRERGDLNQLSEIPENPLLVAPETADEDTEKATATVTAWTEGVRGLTESFETFTNGLGDTYALIAEGTTTLLNSATDSVLEFVMTGKFSFKQFAQEAIKEIQKIIIKMLILKAINAISGGFGGPSFGGGMAEGGAVTPSKLFMVGEKGPELFVPPSSGNIVPNDVLKGMGSQPAPQIQIVNVDDAAAIPEAMMTREGEQAIMNVIQRNRGTLKEVIS